VKAVNSDKASGLVSYSMAFFQACWVVLKEDVMKVFREFHASLKFERSLNAMFPRAVDPKDFRLISLVGSIYKIIAKILANRFKVVLEKTFYKSQNALIHAR
jgi:hypothetical protein